jgi:hypothetical protein
MGRRKQSCPVRVGPDEAILARSSTSPSTTTSSHASTPPSKLLPLINSFTDDIAAPSTKKPKTDFSIKAHLEASKPTTSFNSSLSPQSLSNALKAYETLLNELNRKPNGLKPGPLLQLTKQVDKLASRDGKRDPVTETALDLRVKKPQSPAISSKIQSSSSSKKPTSNTDNDTLRKLSHLVGKAGSSMNASMAAVVKSPANQVKEENDPCKIFTCLQCFERFPGMQELVEHMSKTKHFNQGGKQSNNGFLDPHSLLRQSLLPSQKI